MRALVARRRILERKKQTVLDIEKQNEGLESVQQTPIEVVVIDSDSEVEELREGAVQRSNFDSDPFPGLSSPEKKTSCARENILWRDMSALGGTPLESEDKLKPENESSAIFMISGSSWGDKPSSVRSSTAADELTGIKAAIRVRDIATLMSDTVTNHDDLNCAHGFAGGALSPTARSGIRVEDIPSRLSTSCSSVVNDLKTVVDNTPMVDPIPKSGIQVKDVPSVLSVKCSSVLNDAEVVGSPLAEVPSNMSGVRVKDITSLLSVDCSGVMNFAKTVSKNKHCRNIDDAARSFNRSTVDRRKESVRNNKEKNKKKSKRPVKFGSMPGQRHRSTPQLCEQYVGFSADTHPPGKADSAIAMIPGNSLAHEPSSSARCSTAVGETTGIKTAIRVKDIASLINDSVTNRDDLNGDNAVLSPIAKSGIRVKDVPSHLSTNCRSVVNDTKIVYSTPMVDPIANLSARVEPLVHIGKSGERVIDVPSHLSTNRRSVVNDTKTVDSTPAVDPVANLSARVEPLVHIGKSGERVIDVPSHLSTNRSSVVNDTKTVDSTPVVVDPIANLSARVKPLVHIGKSGERDKYIPSLLSIDCSSGASYAKTVTKNMRCRNIGVANHRFNNSTVGHRKESLEKKKSKNKEKSKRPEKLSGIRGQGQRSGPPPQLCKEYIDFSADTHPAYFYSERTKGSQNQFRSSHPCIRDRYLEPPPSANTPLPNFYTEQGSSMVEEGPQYQYTALNPFIRDRNLDPEVIREMRMERRRLRKVMRRQLRQNRSSSAPFNPNYTSDFDRQTFAGNSASRVHRLQRGRVPESLQNLNFATSKTPEPVDVTVDKAESSPALAVGKAVIPETVPDRTDPSVIKESPLASSTSSTPPVKPPNVEVIKEESSKGVAGPQTCSSAKMPWTALPETSWSSLFYK